MSNPPESRGSIRFHDDAPRRTAAGWPLRSALFRREREHIWRRLDSLITRIEEDGPSSLSWTEALHLPLLYRQTVSSLSTARDMVLDRNLLLYLDNLALRAYLVVYGPRAGLAGRAAGFVLAGFPRLVRGMRFHLALAALILLAGVFAGYCLVMNDADAFYPLVPEAMANGRGPDSTGDELQDALFAPFPGVADTSIALAGVLFRHNTMLGLLSFGLGFLFGVPTALLLMYKGLGLGAMAALYTAHGLQTDFLGWTLLYGVTEILATLLCAAAGFVLAENLIFPGEKSRLDNLAENGRKAAAVVCGAAGMFFIAGVLEGGIGHLADTTPARQQCALCIAAAWLFYFTLAGRKRSDANDG